MGLPVSGWSTAFIITVAVEGVIVGLLLRRCGPALPRIGLLVLFANLATHPIAWFVIPAILVVGTWLFFLVAETWATVAEAIFYRVTVPGLSSRRALLVAVAANAGSFLAGRLIASVAPAVFR